MRRTNLILLTLLIWAGAARATLEPPIVVIAVGTGEVSLHWWPVAGADYYSVYSAPSVDGVFSLAGTTSDTLFVDTANELRKFYYVVGECNGVDLDFFVWDFDRQVIQNAVVRVIAGSDSSDYVTTDGWVHACVTSMDSVTVRAWRNTPSEWGNDTLSSYIRTRKIPANADRVDSIQVQTWDVCDSMDVSPQDYKAWNNTLRGIRINGIRLLGGINPETMNLDTLWYGKINPITGDTLYDWQQDSLQAEAQRIKETLLFPDSPYPTYYQATFTDPEPFIWGYGPSRQHLHLYYAYWDCTIGVYHDIPNNASTTRAFTTISYSMPTICIKAEIATNLFCTNSTPNNTAIWGKSIVEESHPSLDYTLLDKATARVWIQTPPNSRRDDVYGLP